MLFNATYLKGLVIRATDGELGTVDQFYFDDQMWTIRYLVVNTGGWLNGRRVLVSPRSILQTDWPARRLDVALTMKQVENSPDVDTQKPVSRQYEVTYVGYYGYSPYWGGALLGEGFPLMGSSAYHSSGAAQLGASDGAQQEEADSHLRSSDAVAGYHIEASDGEIGHVEGYVVDDEAWAIRYLEIATRNWLPGKKVLISPAWIEQVSWADSKVRVGLSRETIQDAPKYVETTPITREYENRLFATYGRAPYWSQKSEIPSTPSVRNLSEPR